MIILKLYALSLIPALLLAIWMTVYDIRCKHGLSVPDSKFGYNWKPLRDWDQSITMVTLVILLIPVVNIIALILLSAGMLINALATKD